MKSYIELYGEDADSEYFWGPSNYQPIIDAIGTPVVQVDDQDCQGDTRVLFADGDRIGFLIFGWGSCSGCDALQACSNPSEVEELASGMEKDTQWFDSKSDALKFFVERDWDVQWSWGSGETRQFVREALQYLGHDDPEAFVDSISKDSPQ